MSSLSSRPQPPAWFFPGNIQQRPGLTCKVICPTVIVEVWVIPSAEKVRFLINLIIGHTTPGPWTWSVSCYFHPAVRSRVVLPGINQYGGLSRAAKEEQFAIGGNESMPQSCRRGSCSRNFTPDFSTRIEMPELIRWGPVFFCTKIRRICCQSLPPW